MKRTLKDRLISRFPADSLSLRLLSAAAALITIATGLAFLGSIVFSESVRDTLSDFFTLDVKVWHLLLAMGATGTVAVIVALGMRRNSSKESPAPRKVVPYPEEVEHFGVMWPIYTQIVGGTPQFSADKPACPKDRSTLGFAGGDDRLRIFESVEGWENFGPKQMKFGCFKDGSRYDLTGHDVSMREAMQIAVNSAWGKYRTALRKEG